MTMYSENDDVSADNVSVTHMATLALTSRGLVFSGHVTCTLSEVFRSARTKTNRNTNKIKR